MRRQVVSWYPVVVDSHVGEDLDFRGGEPVLSGACELVRPVAELVRVAFGIALAEASVVEEPQIPVAEARATHGAMVHRPADCKSTTAILVRNSMPSTSLYNGQK